MISRDNKPLEYLTRQELEALKACTYVSENRCACPRTGAETPECLLSTIRSKYNKRRADINKCARDIARELGIGSNYKQFYAWQGRNNATRFRYIARARAEQALRYTPRTKKRGVIGKIFLGQGVN